MFKYKKCFVLDENEKPCAVQISIKDFIRIEEVLENYGLAQLIGQNANETALGLDDAKKFYKKLKDAHVAR
jgi:hypothetical protein